MIQFVSGYPTPQQDNPIQCRADMTAGVILSRNALLNFSGNQKFVNKRLLSYLSSSFSGMSSYPKFVSSIFKVLPAICLFVLTFDLLTSCWAEAGTLTGNLTTTEFPRPLTSYEDQHFTNVYDVIKHRITFEPFNLIGTLIFFCAIIHTLLSGKFSRIAKRWEKQHQKKIEEGAANKYSVHHGAKLFTFFGEVEVIFGLWVIVLSLAVVFFYDRATLVNYISHKVNFTEPLFVVTVMILAASRPILKLAESIMEAISRFFGGTLSSWWMTILSIGPVLGSLITEPAAMTISALLLAKKVYDLTPSEKLKYATIGLLFVNISVGGTLTHFAAPPVLMVAGSWDWGLVHMTMNFGWKALVGIFLSNTLYFLYFRNELRTLEAGHLDRSQKDHIQYTFMRRMEMLTEFEKIEPIVRQELGGDDFCAVQTERVMAGIRDRLEQQVIPGIIDQGIDLELAKEVFDQRFEELKLLKLQEMLPATLPPEKRASFIDPNWDARDDLVPLWVTVIHVCFMVWVIVNNHHPELFISGLLFFLGFTVVSTPYQNRIDLISPMLVGFFLGGLVIHGGVQGWWIAPLLGSLSEVPLMLGATILTAFNDNAAITYLSTLVPGLTEELQYAVVSGAVAGGGLTVIANAPNPAGQSILKKYFSSGISPLALLLASLLPTLIVWFCFLYL